MQLQYCNLATAVLVTSFLLLTGCGGGGDSGSGGSGGGGGGTPNYTVTANAGAGGAITPATRTVQSGQTTTFTVTPDTGYSINTVSGCNGSLSGNTYTTGTITGACTVTASFSLISVNSYTVTATAGEGGSISPASQTVNHGATTSFIVTPNTGYNIASVSGCNGSLSGTTYTTGAITGTCTVTASFSINSYSVTASAGDGGSINPASQTVSHGGNISFTVTPNTGYSIASVSGCNGSLSDNTYTTGPIVANCAVQAEFIAVQYQVTAAVVTEGGFITPNSQTVPHGDYAIFRLVKEIHYTLDGESGCGNMLLNGEELIYGPIFSNCHSEIRLTPVNFGNLNQRYLINDKPSPQHPASSIVILAGEGQGADFNYPEQYDGERVTFSVSAEQIADNRVQYTLDFEPGKLAEDLELPLVAKVWSDVLFGQEFPFTVAINASPQLIIADYPATVFTRETVIFDASNTKDPSNSAITFKFYEFKNGERTLLEQAGPLFSIEAPAVEGQLVYSLEAYDELQAYDSITMSLVVNNRPPLLEGLPEKIVRVMSYDDIILNFTTADLDGEVISVTAIDTSYHLTPELRGTLVLNEDSLVFTPTIPYAYPFPHTILFEVKDNTNHRTQHTVEIYLEPPWAVNRTSAGNCTYLDYRVIDEQLFESIYNLSNINNQIYYSYYLQSIPDSLIPKYAAIGYQEDGLVPYSCGTAEEINMMLRRNLRSSLTGQMKPFGLGRLGAFSADTYNRDNFYLRPGWYYNSGNTNTINYLRLSNINGSPYNVLECLGFCQQNLGAEGGGKFKYAMTFYNNSPADEPLFGFDFQLFPSTFMNIDDTNYFEGRLDIIDLHYLGADAVDFTASPQGLSYAFGSTSKGLFSVTADTANNPVASKVPPFEGSSPLFSEQYNNEKYIVIVKDNCEDYSNFLCPRTGQYQLMKRAGQGYELLGEIEDTPAFFTGKSESSIFHLPQASRTERLKHNNLQVTLTDGRKGVLTRTYCWGNNTDSICGNETQGTGRLIFAAVDLTQETILPFMEIFSELNTENIIDVFTFDINEDGFSDFLFLARDSHNNVYSFSYLSTLHGYSRINLGNRGFDLQLSEVLVADSCHLADSRCLLAISGHDLLAIPHQEGGLDKLMVLNDKGLAMTGDMAITDICGNGTNDLLVSSLNNGRIYLYRDIGSNTTTADAELLEHGLGYSNKIITLDINNDGLDDVIITNNRVPSLGQSFLLLYQNTGCSYAKPVKINMPPISDSFEIVSVDINNDGFSDLIFTDLVSGSLVFDTVVSLFQLLNNGSGGFEQATAIQQFLLPPVPPGLLVRPPQLTLMLDHPIQPSYLYVNTVKQIIRYPITDLSGAGEVLFETEDYFLDGLFVDDINQDGKVKVGFYAISMNNDNAKLVILQESNPAGFTVWNEIADVVAPFWVGSGKFTITDINADGCKDIFATADLNKVLYINDCKSGFRVGAPSGMRLDDVTTVLVYDIDKDGDDDFILGGHHNLVILENTVERFEQEP